MRDAFTPVIEIGGTHLTVALVDPATWSVVAGTTTRVELHSGASASQLIDDIASAAHLLGAHHGSEWVVAIPGPFDYREGIGRFENVGKFDSLRNFDVRSALQDAILPRPSFVHFLNDADAFGVGEYVRGAAQHTSRVVCITLGTGIGSAYLVDGEPTNEGPGVPADGSAHLIRYLGKPLEETVSRRAILAAYATAAGLSPGDTPDVREIAELARHGRQPAGAVIDDAFRSLGAALVSSLTDFGATRLVVGGSMAKSWDLVEPALRAGLSGASVALEELDIRPSTGADDAPLVGAAFWAARHARATAGDS